MVTAADLLGQSREYIADRGIVSFALAVIDVAAPEPYGTRFRARRQTVLDVSTAEPPLSLTDRFQALRHGFTTDCYCLYELHEGGDPRGYLDDVTRRAAKYCNDRPELLDDKRKFLRYLRTEGYGAYLPTVYGRIEDGTFYSDDYATIRDLLADRDRVVIKGRTGAAGNHVYICTASGAESLGNHHLTENVPERARGFDDHLVTEYVEQAGYLERIYPDATNTIRVLTLRTDEGTRIAAAAHRFGSARAGALDNFSKGGLSAAVDRETGALSAAAAPTGCGPVWHDHHPDTGAAIAGVSVPGWQEIRDQLRTIAAETAAFDHVGWDIVVTGPGTFRIIEGNSYPDPDVLQVHEPLLARPAVREFYEQRGLL